MYNLNNLNLIILIILITNLTLLGGLNAKLCSAWPGILSILYFGFGDVLS